MGDSGSGNPYDAMVGENGRYIAAVPKQTYDLDRPNRFPVGSLPGNRLRSSCARRVEGASYCWRFDRPVPIDRYLVSFLS